MPDRLLTFRPVILALVKLALPETYRLVEVTLAAFRYVIVELIIVVVVKVVLVVNAIAPLENAISGVPVTEVELE